MGTRHCGGRRAQALVELAIGLLAVTLVLSALLGFSRYIVAALSIQRTVRAEAGRKAMTSVGLSGSLLTASRSKTVEVSGLSADRLLGARSMTASETVRMPAMRIIAVDGE